MNKKIIDFIKSYNISDLEIQDILNIAPMMEVLDYEEFIKNCVLLIEFGYPESDIDVLLLANPSIFIRSNKDLEKDLIQLKKEYGNIEEILKDDPTII